MRILGGLFTATAAAKQRATAWKPRDPCILYVNCFRMNGIKVRVQFYAQLRDLIGKPALRAHDKSILIGAGLEFVDRNYNLHAGEEIAIMPPVQGG
jgi:molybdopterin converting factor small subunit